MATGARTPVASTTGVLLMTAIGMGDGRTLGVPMMAVALILALHILARPLLSPLSSACL